MAIFQFFKMAAVRNLEHWRITLTYELNLQRSKRTAVSVMYVKGHFVRKVIVQIQRHILLTYLLTQNRSIAVHRREVEGR